MAIKKKVPTREYGDCDKRNDGRTPPLQEHDNDENDENDSLADGVNDRIDRLLNELGWVVDDFILQSRREGLGKLVHGRLDGIGGRQRVRSAGRWKMPSATAGSRSR